MHPSVTPNEFWDYNRRHATAAYTKGARSGKREASRAGSLLRSIAMDR